MNLLFDLDCLSKLHICSAFNEAMEVLPGKNKTFFYVDSFPHTAKKLSAKYTGKRQSVYSKIGDRSLLKGWNELKADLDRIEILDKLIKIQNIDLGEAILLYYASRMDDSLLLTGDKRFLTAICENEQSVREIIPDFSEKFVFFLNIVCKICQNDRNKIQLFTTQDAFGSDKGLSAVFGGSPTQESVSEATQSYTSRFSQILYPF